jgi:glycosyltransferase involved in cell wall biosynthesis
MRIVVDLQSCQSGSRLGGIGRYSMNLLQGMARNIGKHDLQIVLSNLMPDGLGDIYHSLEDLIPKHKIRYFHVAGGVAEAFEQNVFRARAAELLRESFIQGLQPDVVHVSSLFEGLGDDVTTSVGRLCNGETTAVTLYDLIPLVESEKYLTSATTTAHYYRKLDDLKRAGLMLSISEFSKFEATDVCGIDPSIITNISSAVDKKFVPGKLSLDEEKAIKKKYGVVRNYLMYTGSFDQRKNHEGLIRAFAALPTSTRRGLQLMIVGNGWSGIYDHLRNLGSQLGLAEDDLIFAGKVPDQDLLPLYRLCHLFVFPSLREGFGLPVLEAMSCGIPVIGSNTTSIPEVLGNASAMFNPNDVDSIASKINEAVTDKGFRDSLIAKGLVQCKNFSWDTSAKRAIEAFEALHERRQISGAVRVTAPSSEELIQTVARLPEFRHATDLDLIATANGIEEAEAATAAAAADTSGHARRDMSRVGVVSTWNTRCGIAMYSKYLIEKQLESYVVLAPEEDELVAPDEPNVLRCWKAGSDDLMGLFAAIIKEDIRIVLIQFNYGFFEFDQLREFIKRLVIAGRSVSITLHSTHDPVGYENKELKAVEDGLVLCDSVYVHSERDVETLNALGLSRNVKLFPQGVYQPGEDEIALRGSDKSFVVASYGFFLPHKGFHELIEAAHILRRKKVDIRLLMVNSLHPAPISKELVTAARAKIREFGLEGHVSLITDFLSEELTIQLLRNADLVVYPYQVTGESSSAAVRMGLASGVPVAVTPLSIFDDVSDIVFQLPGVTPSELARGIEKTREHIAADSSTARAIGQRAKRWKAERGFSFLGRKLQNQLRDNRRYFGDDGRIRTNVGERDGAKIRTTGVAGCLLYGPYASLDAGHYKAVLHGVSEMAGDQLDATVEVVTGAEHDQLASSKLTVRAGDDVLATLNFFLPQACSDLEVRVWASAKTSLYLSLLEIEPWERTIDAQDETADSDERQDVLVTME